MRSRVKGNCARTASQVSTEGVRSVRAYSCGMRGASAPDPSTTPVRTKKALRFMIPVSFCHLLAPEADSSASYRTFLYVPERVVTLRHVQGFAHTFRSLRRPLLPHAGHRRRGGSPGGRSKEVTYLQIFT